MQSVCLESTHSLLLSVNLFELSLGRVQEIRLEKVLHGFEFPAIFLSGAKTGKICGQLTFASVLLSLNKIKLHSSISWRSRSVNHSAVLLLNDLRDHLLCGRILLYVTPLNSLGHLMLSSACKSVPWLCFLNGLVLQIVVGYESVAVRDWFLGELGLNQVVTHLLLQTLSKIFLHFHTHFSSFSV